MRVFPDSETRIPECREDGSRSWRSLQSEALERESKRRAERAEQVLESQGQI